MNSCVFFLHYHFTISTFFIILAVSLSRGDDARYTACSIPYKCGNFKVDYPFWSDDRPKFCGIPDLKLKCSDEIHATIDVYIPGYAPLSVVHIDAVQHSMTVSNLQELAQCDASKPVNKTLSPSLKPDTGFENIDLFYNCAKKCNTMYRLNSLNCSNAKGTYDPVFYFNDEPDISRLDKSCSCKNSLTFPMDVRALAEFRTRNVSLGEVLRKWPDVKLRYTANFTACSKCEKSGGRCGSSEDPSVDQFVCYCRNNGPQPLMCHSESDKKKRLKIILGLGSVGVVFILAAIVAIWLCKRRKLGGSKFVDRCASLDCSASDLERGSRYFGVPLFSYRELVEATNNFDQSNELGNGGFGTVYHGKLKDQREVAVKRLYEKSYKRIEQFMNEIHILTRLRHHNLVSLYGCTSQHCRELLLVYEYVNNGTVADHLFSENTTSASSLPWPVRLRIAIETATALSYLHASDIIHRDVKTNNILLDSNFCVKVADFGLSRLFPTDVTHVSTAPQGTPGYVDPEYHQCYQLTDKSDVYSFGVVLIELISSLPAVDMDRHRNEINLSNYAANRIQQGAYHELVDPKLGFATDFKVRRMTISVAELAFQCLQHDKGFRPSMDEVLEVLKSIEGADYEALLQAEEMSKNAEKEVANLHSSKLPPPPSPTEHDHEQLLRNHQLHPASPISVIEKWVSRSTTLSSSK